MFFWALSGVLFSVLLGASPAAAAFQPGYGLPGLDGRADDFALFDDGGGERLYVTGPFLTVGDLTVQGIAAWDGTTWQALAGPSGPVGLRGAGAALAVFDDGSGPALYVGGAFTTAGDVTASRIARWDGTSWSALGTGMNANVVALEVFDDGTGPALYAGGYFSSAGGVAVQSIARWDGLTWSSLSSNLSGLTRVFAMTVHDDGGGPALYVGGEFQTMDGQTANNVARWDGTSWTALGAAGGEGVAGKVQALASFDAGSGAELYVGGSIQAAGGTPAGPLVRFDGAAWSALPGGSGAPTGTVQVLSVVDLGDGPRLAVGATEYDDPSNRLVLFDGTSWSSPVTEQPGRRGPWALEVFDDGDGPALYVGGDFESVGERHLSHVTVLEAGSLESLVQGPTRGASDIVNDFAVYDSQLYVVGPSVVGGLANPGVARRPDGGDWQTIVDGAGRKPSGGDRLLAYDDGSGEVLIVGGAALEGPGAVGSTEALMWDGTTWTELGEITGTFLGLAAYDDGSGIALYASGDLTIAGEVEDTAVARWDGVAWTSVLPDSQVIGSIRTLEAFDGWLYLGGIFEDLNGQNIENIARWDGAVWEEPGTLISIDTIIYDLHVFDDGGGPSLYLTGNLFGYPSQVARWDETTGDWVGVGQSLDNVDGRVLGTGAGVSGETTLYLGGTIGPGGQPKPFIRRLNGSTWEELASSSLRVGQHGFALALADLADLGSQGN